MKDMLTFDDVFTAATMFSYEHVISSFRLAMRDRYDEWVLHGCKKTVGHQEMNGLTWAQWLCAVLTELGENGRKWGESFRPMDVSGVYGMVIDDYLINEGDDIGAFSLPDLALLGEFDALSALVPFDGNEVKMTVVACRSTEKNPFFVLFGDEDRAMVEETLKLVKAMRSI